MCEDGDTQEVDSRAEGVHPRAREHHWVGSIHGSIDTSKQHKCRGVELAGFAPPRLAFYNNQRSALQDASVCPASRQDLNDLNGTSN